MHGRGDVFRLPYLIVVDSTAIENLKYEKPETIGIDSRDLVAFNGVPS